MTGILGAPPELVHFGRNITTEIRRANRLFAPIRELIRESSLNMTKGADEHIETGLGVGGGGGGGGLRKFLDTRKKGSKKIVGLGEGLRKFAHFKTNARHHHTDRMALISTQQFN